MATKSSLGAPLVTFWLPFGVSWVPDTDRQSTREAIFWGVAPPQGRSKKAPRPPREKAEDTEGPRGKAEGRTEILDRAKGEGRGRGT